MKLKVLLVDDELLIRLGIKSIIDWESQGFIIGDAPDGQKALEMMEQEQPDILLTDIVMPRMNGLELIEHVKARYPHVRIIVLSSHNDYEYLRRAMKLGVDDYILKASMKPEELLELLLETAEKIRVDQQEMERHMTSQQPVEDRSKAWSRWLHHVIEAPGGSEDEANSGLALSSANRCMVLRIHRSNHVSMELEPNQTTLRNLLELELNKWLKGYVIPYLDNEWVLLIPEERDKAILLEQTKLIAQDLISAARRFLNASVSIGISRRFSEASYIQSVYLQTRDVLQLYFVEGKEKVFACEEHAALDPSAFVISREEENRLKTELDRLNGEELQTTIRAIFARMREVRKPVENYIQACLRLLHLIPTSSFGEGSPLYKQVLGFEELEEARQWFERFLQDHIERAKQTMRETYREEIMQLLLHMKSHYKQDLSLGQAAGLINMSESYLSFLFKKEMNVSFTEYLNQLRIEKAVELLLETELPSYRIAEEVGYENINYFGRVFKKQKGVSPQQYRNQHQ
ncbi:response regulator transcription factor [Paenibacillus eucommiae]|uniref:Two-component system response regulator YesN n=1 Tax=Paenibacillus eucommiae TaxID=1355755 RepID=A0ABS4J251_9BACL|nr:response regulator [Paenibacillus eucommiae]MBP1993331.1 two-component system response regulator YesN [Paenibacillus eucommiae]